MKIYNEELNHLVDIIFLELTQYKNENSTVHPYDIAQQLQRIREIDKDEYLNVLKKIPHNLFADILSEMPEYIQEEITELLTTKKIADIASKMDTDDAASFIQNLSATHEDTAQGILERFEDQDKEMIEHLMAYNSNQAGSYMQTELYNAKLSENIGHSIKKLKLLKEANEINNIWQVHIVDDSNKYLGSVGLEELILFERELYFKDIPFEKYKNYYISNKADIKEVVEMFTNYNLTSIAVVNDDNKLLGRITSDDIYDIMNETATEQIYNLAGVNDEAEQEENIFVIGKTRAMWLTLNLFTAIAASLVIGMFDATIQSLVALAILMPIVASMGGNAGTQTLTVTVRQMALGDIVGEDAKKTIYKEVIISLVNGLLFAFIIGFIAYFWFGIPMLGIVIAVSMIINLISAGFFGSLIPLLLQKVGIDPAIGSTVLLTTVTDVVGFFSFLGLATLILL